MKYLAIAIVTLAFGYGFFITTGMTALFFGFLTFCGANKLFD